MCLFGFILVQTQSAKTAASNHSKNSTRTPTHHTIIIRAACTVH